MSHVSLNLNVAITVPLVHFFKYKNELLKRIENVKSSLSNTHSQSFKRKCNDQLNNLHNQLIHCEISILHVHQSQLTNQAPAQNVCPVRQCELPQNVAALAEVHPSQLMPVNTSLSSYVDSSVPSEKPLKIEIDEQTSGLFGGQSNTLFKIALSTAFVGVCFFFGKSSEHVLAAAPVNVAKSSDAEMLTLFYESLTTILKYVYGKGHNLDWLVRHGKISQELFNFICSKGGLQALWK